MRPDAVTRGARGGWALPRAPRRGAALALMVLATALGGAAQASVRPGPLAPVPEGGAPSAVVLTSPPPVTSVPSSTSTPASPTSGKKPPKGRKSKPAPPQVLNPGTTVLLQEVATDERQVVSLDAYGDALRDVKAASTAAWEAGREFAADQSSWEAARAQLRRAVLGQRGAAQWVGLYEHALYELGIAEYTGQTLISSSSLRVAQHQLVINQLGQVAAVAGGGGLDRALQVLAVAMVYLHASRALLARTTGTMNAERVVLELARSQLARSQRALAVARTWALVPLAAPSQPLAILAVMERPTPPVPSPEAAPLSAAPAGGGRQYFMGPDGELLVNVPARRSTTTTSPPTSRQTGAKAPPVGVLTLAEVRALGPTIMGPDLLTPAQVTSWWESTGAEGNASVPMAKLIDDYINEGRLSGVRPDIAFAQSVVETGYFSFPAFGQDPPSYNNFAGIGACDTCRRGFRYSNAAVGVAAQQRLLEEYALPYAAPTIFAPFGVAGSSQTWMALSGVWATNINYGYSIMSVYQQMLTFVIQKAMGRYSLSPQVRVATTLNPPAKSSPAPSRNPRT